jgi:ABC-type uncharacterized transport system substrate-binding protein
MPRPPAVSLLALLIAAPAGAHPHVFVDAGAGFRLDGDGRLEGLRISWTYDEFTSLVLLDVLDIDADGDGELDDADRAAIVAGETDWPDDYDGDVHLEVGGAPRALGRPEGGEAGLEDGRITVRFDLPLAEPAELGDATAVLRLYDPTYFYAYTVVAAPAPGELPAGCVADLLPFVPDAATAELQAELAALSREEVPEQEGVGRLFADEVVLRCD